MLRNTTPTLKQFRVLRTIHALTTAHGFPPTIRELATRLRLASTNSVVDHLEALAAKRHLTWRPNSPRTLSITLPGHQWLKLSVKDLTRELARQSGERRQARAAERRASKGPGAPAGNRNANRENRAAKAARVAAELAAARGAA